MNISDMFQLVSVLLELVIAILGIMIYLKNKKAYGLGIALAFAIYVFYDLANFGMFNINLNILYLTFFTASISILWAVWKIYKEK